MRNNVKAWSSLRYQPEKTEHSSTVPFSSYASITSSEIYSAVFFQFILFTQDLLFLRGVPFVGHWHPCSRGCLCWKEKICWWIILPLSCQCKWKGGIDGWVADSIINHCKCAFKLVLLKNYVYYFFQKIISFKKFFCNFKIFINFFGIFFDFFKIYYFDNFFNK